MLHAFAASQHWSGWSNRPRLQAALPQPLLLRSIGKGFKSPGFMPSQHFACFLCIILALRYCRQAVTECKISSKGIPYIVDGIKLSPRILCASRTKFLFRNSLSTISHCHSCRTIRNQQVVTFSSGHIAYAVETQNLASLLPLLRIKRIKWAILRGVKSYFQHHRQKTWISSIRYMQSIK